MILGDEIMRKNYSCVGIIILDPLLMLECDFESFKLINLGLV